jgi:hypothetical protein
MSALDCSIAQVVATHVVLALSGPGVDSEVELALN